MSEESKLDEGSITDMTGKKTSESRPEMDPLEKEQREAAKKDAKKAPKGAYVCADNIKSDGKLYKRGEVYDGKVYPGMVESGRLITKEEWDARP